MSNGLLAARGYRASTQAFHACRPPMLSETRHYSHSIISTSRDSSTNFIPCHRSQDLVGPPSPRSNIRPIRYGSPFPLSATQLSNSSSDGDANGHSSSSSPVHPYSLNEFTSQFNLLPSTLVELKNKLTLEDLEWTLFRKRIDKMNEVFWATQSTAFEGLEAAERTRVGNIPSFQTLSTGQQNQLVDSALDTFYQKWLLDEEARFNSYTLQWWNVQLALLRGSWKAQRRVWTWRWACWRHGWQSLRS